MGVPFFVFFPPHIPRPICSPLFFSLIIYIRVVCFHSIIIMIIMKFDDRINQEQCVPERCDRSLDHFITVHKKNLRANVGDRSDVREKAEG